MLQIRFLLQEVLLSHIALSMLFLKTRYFLILEITFWGHRDHFIAFNSWSCKTDRTLSTLGAHSTGNTLNIVLIFLSLLPHRPHKNISLRFFVRNDVQGASEQNATILEIHLLIRLVDLKRTYLYQLFDLVARQLPKVIDFFVM